MKLFKYMVLAVVVTSMLSCNDWLNVDPKTEKGRDVLFSSEAGAFDALAGVYIQMRNNNAYGERLTLSTLDRMASLYTPNPRGGTNTEIALQSHNYTDTEVEKQINSIYTQLYTIISRVNGILDVIDNYENVFSPGLFRILKGEALGIRAMCHFDLLRIYGPVPKLASDERTLPYITKLNTSIDIPQSYSTFCAMLINDLKDAESYLSEDPIKTGKTTNSEYLQDRTYFMNYYAVKALQARVNLYIGNESVAYEAAREVIVASEGGLFRLANQADLNNRDYTYSSEHIFAIDYDQKAMSDRSERMYGNPDVDSPYYLVDQAKVRQKRLFGNKDYDKDMRSPGVSDNFTVFSSGNKWIINKYRYNKTEQEAEDAMNNPIALIRLSEMYLIAIETAPDMTTSLKYWKTYRNSRGLQEIIDGDGGTPLTVGNLKESVLSEYRKEFYGEGQLFYAYKRMNSSTILFFPSDASINYVVPKPKSETFFED